MVGWCARRAGRGGGGGIGGEQENRGGLEIMRVSTKLCGSYCPIYSQYTAMTSYHDCRPGDDTAYAKVGQHRVPTGSHEDVVGLQVQNHYTVTVKLLETVQDVGGHLERLG